MTSETGIRPVTAVFTLHFVGGLREGGWRQKRKQRHQENSMAVGNHAEESWLPNAYRIKFRGHPDWPPPWYFIS